MVVTVRSVNGQLRKGSAEHGGPPPAGRIWRMGALAALLVCLLCACASGSSGRSALVLTAEAEAAGVVSEGGSERAASSDPQVAEPEAAAVPVAAPEAAAPATIVVHVCGAVAREGVYTLEAGSRVYEAVAAAGGFTADADEAYINQAEILSDGVRLRIPTREETAAAQGGESAPAQVSSELSVISGGQAGGEGGSPAGGKVNINTADAEALCRLTGVGTGIAAKIIAYREANGPFSRIEDIMQVSGIKEKLFAKIRDEITV